MKYQNIWCVGRNFKDHAMEMNAKVPEAPIIFLKSGSTVVQDKPQFSLPDWAIEVHHEIELAVQISEVGLPLSATLALDLTERHFQNLAKKNGTPWTLAKSFKGSTILGAWSPWNPDFLKEEIQLKVNGTLKQKGSMTDLIFTLPQITEFVVKHFPVCQGDVLLLGTPSGVGPLNKTDFLEAQLGESLHFSWTVN